MEMALPPDAKSGPNCGITAIAIIAKISFEDAVKVFKKIRISFGYGKYAKLNHGSTFQSERLKALDLLNIKYVVLENDHPLVTPPWRKPLALKYWMRHPLRDLTKTYMVSTTGHIQVVRGDVVIDQSGPKKINEFWGKGKKVKGVIEIIS